MFRQTVPSPNDVFTPTRLPLSEHNAYVHRAKVEAGIKRFLSRGQVPLIFGEYAVGKTTVVQKVLRDLGFEKELVYLPTTAGKSMSDVFRIVLESLGVTVTTEEVVTTGTSGHLGAALFVDAGVDHTRETARKESFVIQSPTDERVIQLMREHEVTLVVDELHRASPDFREALADFVKATHGQAELWPQVVLVGTTSDASSLVRIDPGIDRFVRELRVAPMTGDESESLIRSGFGTLKIGIQDETVNAVVRTAAGAPSLIQSVCLDMAEACVREGRHEAGIEDYRNAVRSYLEENMHRLNESYAKAIEHTGPKRYRKQVLIAMSVLDSEFAELEEIRENIEKRLGESVAQTALSGPLRMLKNGSDSVLVDVTRRDGDRVYNVSTFRDPMMKSFIRFITEVESQGLVRL